MFHPCRQDSALHGLELPQERTQLVLGVAAVMEGMVHDAVQYRVGKAALYQSFVSTEGAEPEFLPWTGADQFHGVLCPHSQVFPAAWPGE